MSEVMLTTTDNPYDPFSQFEDWYNFDETQGYHTCSYLARIAKTSQNISEKDNDEEIDRAMDDIIRLDVTGKYKKTKPEDWGRG